MLPSRIIRRRLGGSIRLHKSYFYHGANLRVAAKAAQTAFSPAFTYSDGPLNYAVLCCTRKQERMGQKDHHILLKKYISFEKCFLVYF